MAPSIQTFSTQITSTFVSSVIVTAISYSLVVHSYGCHSWFVITQHNTTPTQALLPTTKFKTQSIDPNNKQQLVVCACCRYRRYITLPQLHLWVPLMWYPTWPLHSIAYCCCLSHTQTIFRSPFALPFPRSRCRWIHTLFPAPIPR